MISGAGARVCAARRAPGGTTHAVHEINLACGEVHVRLPLQSLARALHTHEALRLQRRRALRLNLGLGLRTCAHAAGHQSRSTNPKRLEARGAAWVRARAYAHTRCVHTRCFARGRASLSLSSPYGEHAAVSATSSSCSSMLSSGSVCASRTSAACEPSQRFRDGGFQSRFPPAVAHRLLLIALTAAIEWPGIDLCLLKSGSSHRPRREKVPGCAGRAVSAAAGAWP